MSNNTTAITAIPRALESYPSAADQTLAADLAMRMRIEPFNAIATGVFLLAILHTFWAARFTRLAHHVQRQHDDEARGLLAGPCCRPSLPRSCFACCDQMLQSASSGARVTHSIETA